uniref:Uncharacterized protein n=1 Tax=Anopheles albimanus TaxID=7167 RepID=A0A182FXV0_ANOAL
MNHSTTILRSRAVRVLAVVSWRKRVYECVCVCVWCLQSRLLRTGGSNGINGTRVSRTSYFWSKSLPFASLSSSFPFFIGFHSVMFRSSCPLISVERGIFTVILLSRTSS